MAKKNCELCQNSNSTINYFSVNLCKDCYALCIDANSNNDATALQLLCEPNAFPNATNLARSTFIERAMPLLHESNAKKTAEQAAEQARIIAEERHQEFAKSFNEFYEYDVVTIINKDHGTVDREHMMKVLADHASKGWKLHSVYSNELGKNALSLLGLGLNSTACEDVLIFERRVERI